MNLTTQQFCEPQYQLHFLARSKLMFITRAEVVVKGWTGMIEATL